MPAVCRLFVQCPCARWEGIGNAMLNEDVMRSENEDVEI
jgi:hypothetical protein